MGVADVLLFCTGYNFSFPFLDAAQLGLEVKDHLVTPLYRHLMPPAFPSLFIIGICKIICPFPHFNCQVNTCFTHDDGVKLLKALLKGILGNAGDHLLDICPICVQNVKLKATLQTN